MGPYYTHQLRAMKSKGQLHKFHEISADKVNWFPASDFTDLFPDFTPAADKKPAEEKLDKGGLPALERNRGMRRLASPMFYVFLIGTIVLMLGGAGLGVWLWQRQKENEKNASQAQDGAITNLDEDRLAKAIGLVVCGCEVTGEEGDQWIEGLPLGNLDTGLFTGTCFVVSSQGHLLTNAHVIEKVRNLMRAPSRSRQQIPKVWVFLNRKRYEANILHVSENYDFGLLRIDVDTPTYFRLNTSAQIARNTPVTAYGFPAAARIVLPDDDERRLIYEKLMARRIVKIDDCFRPQDLVFSSTSGVVGRMWTEKNGRAWIEHDATISGGNSGGPLVDREGTVVGINTLAVAGTGIHEALLLLQLKAEIDKYVPRTVWK